MIITGPKSFLVVEFSASFDFLSSGVEGATLQLRMRNTSVVVSVSKV
jgi:hypothetical protein